MVIGLICNEEGCPIGVEVFPGNTQDAKTVPEKIEEIQKTYGIAELIFVGDRGMMTSANYEKVKGRPGLFDHQRPYPSPDRFPPREEGHPA